MKFTVTIAGRVYKYAYIPYSKEINKELNRKHNTTGKNYCYLYILIHTGNDNVKRSKPIELSNVVPIIVKDPLLVAVAKNGKEKQIKKNIPIIFNCTLESKVNKKHGTTTIKTIGGLPSLNSVLIGIEWQTFSNQPQIDNDSLKTAVVNTLNPNHSTLENSGTQQRSTIKSKSNKQAKNNSKNEVKRRSNNEKIPSHNEQNKSYNNVEQDLDPASINASTKRLDDAENDLYNFLDKLDSDEND